MSPPGHESAARATLGTGLPSLPAPAAQVGWRVRPRDAACLLLLALPIAWLWAPLRMVMSLSLSYGVEHYSHLVLIPVVSAALMWLDRRTIFSRVGWAAVPGGLVLAAGGALAWLAGRGPVTDPGETHVSLAMLALVVLSVGAVWLCYGTAALRAAAFPLGFLLFMVPLPPALLHAVVVLLQRASAEMTYVLFGLLGVPVYREGFFFALPGLAIEVAEQCSGIRSFLALTITCVLASHLLLRRAWTRGMLLLAILPIAIVKNAVRIVVLSLLAIHVDPSFITGSMVHRAGGIPLFFATLLLVGSLIWLLQRAESRRRPADGVKALT